MSMVMMTTVWEEVETPIAPTSDEMTNKRKKKPPRQQWISFGSTSMDYTSPYLQSSSSLRQHQQSSAASSSAEPHPLRTNEWKIQVRWKRRWNQPGMKYDNKNNNINTLLDMDLLLDFDADGFVRWCSSPNVNTTAVASNAATAKITKQQQRTTKKDPSTDRQHHHQEKHQAATTMTTAIGTWKLLPSGICWNLPPLLPLLWLEHKHDIDHNNDNIDSKNDDDAWKESNLCYYQFHANFHMNPFGIKPKMVRGIITQCHRRCGSSSSTSKGKWWSRWWSNAQQRRRRPVVGTFVGMGVGADLNDVSFRQRGFGLPKLPPPTSADS